MALDIFKDHVSQHSWLKNEDIMNAMKAPLLRLCARYLYLEKKRGNALNSVGGYHFSVLKAEKILITCDSTVKPVLKTTSK